jgi:hypothetical protein
MVGIMGKGLASLAVGLIAATGAMHSDLRDYYIETTRDNVMSLERSENSVHRFAAKVESGFANYGTSALALVVFGAGYYALMRKSE